MEAYVSALLQIYPRSKSDNLSLSHVRRLLYAARRIDVSLIVFHVARLGVRLKRDHVRDLVNGHVLYLGHTCAVLHTPVIFIQRPVALYINMEAGNRID